LDPKNLLVKDLSWEPEILDSYRNKVLAYYAEKARIFPWRYSNSPWAILMSEFMLQQTQTSRVIDYFTLFTQRFPKPSDLASCEKAELFSLWQGLGYNRRALYLKETARLLSENYGDAVPADYACLVACPGIGPNTAGAILVYSFNIPQAFLETNIKAALIHEFFPHEEAVQDAQLLELSRQLMSLEDPRTWFYALVDYGVEIKKTYGNPTRKSKTYQKQSRFEGSLRQVRGSLIRCLLKNPGIERENLKRAVEKDLGFETLYYEEALNKLLSEGLVSEKAQAYYLD